MCVYVCGIHLGGGGGSGVGFFVVYCGGGGGRKYIIVGAGDHMSFLAMGRGVEFSFH